MWFWQRREVYMGKDGRNYTGADRRMTNAHSADAGIWYVYVRSADLEAAEGVAQRALRGG